MKTIIDHTEDLMSDQNEQFATVDIVKHLKNLKLSPRITAHLGTQRGDSLIRPRLLWHPVSVAATALQAIQKIKSGVEYDLIVCDLKMPRMNGVEFFNELSGLPVRRSVFNDHWSA